MTSKTPLPLTHILYTHNSFLSMGLFEFFLKNFGCFPVLHKQIISHTIYVQIFLMQFFMENELKLCYITSCKCFKVRKNC